MDHVGGDVFGQESGLEGGGVVIVAACLDVEEKGRDPELGPLKGPDLVGEGEACIKGDEAWEGAVLVVVEQSFSASDGG